MYFGRTNSTHSVPFGNGLRNGVTCSANGYKLFYGQMPDYNPTNKFRANATISNITHAANFASRKAQQQNSHRSNCAEGTVIHNFVLNHRGTCFQKIRRKQFFSFLKACFCLFGADWCKLPGMSDKRQRHVFVRMHENERRFFASHTNCWLSSRMRVIQNYATKNVEYDRHKHALQYQMEKDQALSLS